MTSPIEIIDLRAYEGPNIAGPQTGVLLRVRCTANYSKRLSGALKDGAQFIGMVLAYLDVTTTHTDEHMLITAQFTTPTPALGAALASYVVDSICTEATRAHSEPDDDEADSTPWDADRPLVELQQRRRQEALGMPALQLLAEARARSVPVLVLPDDRLQFGYGCKSWQVHTSLLRLARDDDDDDEQAAPLPPSPPWERLGAIPIYAVTGERHRRAITEQVAALLHARGIPVHVLHDADYAATRAMLADPDVRCAVLGLDTADVLQRGIAFAHCTQAIVTDAEGTPPPSAQDMTEWVQALGVPMLLSTQPAILNSADPAVATLAHYAPAGAHPLHDLEHELVVPPTA
jgi:hypothetical protein